MAAKTIVTEVRAVPGSKKPSEKPAVLETPPSSQSDAAAPASSKITFGEKLKSLIRPEGGRKNPRLRETIQEALQITETDLYYWQNPPKNIIKRKSVKPTRSQIIRLGMILADHHGSHRGDLVAELLNLAGLPVTLNKALEEDSKDRIHDDLDKFYRHSTNMLSHCLPSGLPDGTAGISMGCYLSQHLLNHLSKRWTDARRGGHIVFFWRWQNGRLERYFEGHARDAMQTWVEELLTPGGEEHTWITIFLCLEGSSLSPILETEILVALKGLGPKVNNRLTVYVEADSQGKAEFFDLGLLINSSETISFMMVSYPELYRACIGLEEYEKDSLQKAFNPIQWTTNITLMGKEDLHAYLREKGIKEPLPGSSIPLPSTSRWKCIKSIKPSRNI